jgi:hypothetical protein
MAEIQTERQGQPGDWVVVRGRRGEAAKRGEILEVLGGPGHEHYRVRWSERHESILYPADGVSIVRGDAAS